MVSRAVVFLVTVLFVALTSGEATAQMVSVGANIIRGNSHPKGVDTKTITFDDCVNDDTMDLAITATAASSYALEIWAGDNTRNCASDADRKTSGVQPNQCWKLYTQVPAQTTTIRLKVLDILPHGASGPDTGTLESCRNLASTGQGSGKLVLYFLLSSGVDQTTGNGYQLPIQFDLQGPAAPTGLRVGIGDTRLYPSWTLPATTVDTKGYYIYCEQADRSALPSGTGGSTSTSGGAGTDSATGGTSTEVTGTGGDTDVTGSGGAAPDVSGDGGASSDATGTGGATSEATGGDTSSEDSACRAPHLRKGEVPPPELQVGRAGVNSTSGEASGLQNNVVYACAVAGYDTFNNLGLLSELVCGVPEDVNGYFENYREAGGHAGGGYCAFGHAPITAASGSIGLLALSWLVRRRRRRVER